MSFESISRIAILVFPGVDDMDYTGPLRVLRAAVQLGKGGNLRKCDLLTYAPYNAADLITTAYGVQVKVDGLFSEEDFASYDLLLVPGGGWASRADRGAYAELQNQPVITLLRHASESNPKLLFASVCTGAMLLAHAGLFKQNDAASTHHLARSDLVALGVKVDEERVVFGDRIASSGGVTSGIDLALNIVARCCGRESADQIAAVMEYDYSKV
ncbi:ThiJ/PfpI domain-containing protein [Obelidium mucronatum]|nr:ThiJ/PfpI domain-containing protein [Obelidium mucronatum]